MQQKGKFLLFSIDEFNRWLEQSLIHRLINVIQNHHTFSPDYHCFSGSNHFELLEGMESYHIKNAGFSEIAQNLTTFPDGKVAVCRSLDKIPAGCKGANQTGICIEHLGNFDWKGDAMAEAHRKTILQVNAALCQKFQLEPSSRSLLYHHWFDLDTGTRTEGAGNTKTCPGTAFFGGNTVADAEQNFIPLVKKELETLEINPISPGKTGEVLPESLNIRSGPSGTFPITGQLAHGVQVRIYEEKSGWARIHPMESRWVSRQYLS